MGQFSLRLTNTYGCLPWECPVTHERNVIRLWSIIVINRALSAKQTWETGMNTREERDDNTIRVCNLPSPYTSIYAHACDKNTFRRQRITSLLLLCQLRRFKKEKKKSHLSIHQISNNNFPLSEDKMDRCMKMELIARENEKWGEEETEGRRKDGFSKPHGLAKSLPRTNKGLEKPLIQVQLIPAPQSAGSRTTRNSARQYIALRYEGLFEV